MSIDNRSRRGLIGLQEVGRVATTPTEVLNVRVDDMNHHVTRQTMSGCVNGIDNWWVETACARKLVVTQSAERPTNVTCLECLFHTLEVPPSADHVLKPASMTLTEAMMLPPHLR
jgi:hypothetical protein